MPTRGAVHTSSPPRSWIQATRLGKRVTVTTLLSTKRESEREGGWGDIPNDPLEAEIKSLQIIMLPHAHRCWGPKLEKMSIMPSQSAWISAKQHFISMNDPYLLIQKVHLWNLMCMHFNLPKLLFLWNVLWCAGRVSTATCCAGLATAVVSDSLWPQELEPPRLPSPWVLHALLWGSSPGRNRTHSPTPPALAGRFFIASATWEAPRIANCVYNL